MALYLVSVYRPIGFDPAPSLDAGAHREIDQLNDEMVAAGVRVFVGGLQLPSTATWLGPEVPPVTGDAYLDGFWVLDVAHLDEALGWGRKAGIACRALVEVRPFH